MEKICLPAVTVCIYLHLENLSSKVFSADDRDYKRTNGKKVSEACVQASCPAQNKKERKKERRLYKCIMKVQTIYLASIRAHILQMYLCI